MKVEGGGGGGGGGSFTPGPLLSGIAGNNNDTVLNAPTLGSLIVGNATPLWDKLPIGTAGQVLTVVGGTAAWATGGSGTVTSVGLTVPSFLSVSGSPVTTSGVLAVTLATQSANLVFAGPGSGGAVAPTFRSLVVADLPTVDVPHGGTGNTTFTAFSVICAGTTATGAFQNVSGVGTSGQVLTSNGAGALPTWQTVSSAGGGWTDDGAVVRLTTSTDNVSIGTAAAGGKLFIVGDTDEIQAEIRANASQTADVLSCETSAGTRYASFGPPVLPTSDGTISFLRIQATSSASTVTQYGAQIDITTTGSAAGSQRGTLSQLNAGYTGSASTVALYAHNAVAGTGTTPFAGAVNVGCYGQTDATTTGTNIGLLGQGNGGNLSIGIFGKATTDKNSGTNVGVAGFGQNQGSSPIEVGGFFGLMASVPTFVSCALICDNGAEAVPIFIARDNGTAVMTIADGGAVTLTTPLGVASGGTGVATTSANLLFAGPISGGAAAPAFRSLIGADLTGISVTFMSMSTNRMLGRTTAGTGVIEEITVGSGLTFTATTLSLSVPLVRAETDAATITITASNYVAGARGVGTVTLGGNRTLSFSGGTSGQLIELIVKQDGTGSRTLTADSSIEFGTSITNFSGITATANSETHIVFEFRSTTSKWRPLAINGGF